MDPLRFSFNLTFSDYVRAIRAYSLRQPSPLVTIVMAFTGLIALTSIVFDFVNKRPLLTSALTSYMGPFVFVGLILPPYMLGIRPLLVAQQARKNPDSMGAVTWEMDAEHIRIQSVRIKSKVEWSVYEKVFETKQDYLLVYAANRRLIQIIPKRAFESTEQETAFRGYIEAHIGPIK